MRHLCLWLLLLTAALPLCAQRYPAWMNELPVAANDTYVYEREVGDGATVAEATQQALGAVMLNTARRLGLPFDAQQVSQAIQQGVAIEVLQVQYNVPMHKVDDYAVLLPSGTYRVWVLCQVAVAGNVQPQWSTLQREGEASNGMALLKSLFVPGLGQMGKGYMAEGICTLLGQVALVGTAVGCYYMAQAELATMRSASISYSDFEQSGGNYQVLRTTSYIAWGAAGALYAFNLARAAFAQPRRNRSLALCPTMQHSGQSAVAGISLTLKF